MRRITSLLDYCRQSTVGVDSQLATSIRSDRARMTQRRPRPLTPKESTMTPCIAVITRSASRGAAIGLQSRLTSTVTPSPLARLAQAEKSPVCSELRCLPKDRLPPPCALYGVRHGCNDQPERSGYLQVARVDCSPRTWWVWSEFLLRARRCSEADRRRDANSPVRAPRGGTSCISPSRQEPPTPFSKHPDGTAQRPLTPVIPGWGHARQHSLEEGNNERQSRSD
jgi:hypothetical protein